MPLKYLKIKGNFETFFFSSFISIQGCLYPNAAVHEPECLIFRRHQPKKLKVELDSTIPHPLYAIVVPLRLLALRNSNRRILEATHERGTPQIWPKWPLRRPNLAWFGLAWPTLA